MSSHQKEDNYLMGEWRDGMPWLTGYPREKLNWHPSIDPKK